jgi:hypothetical protein
MMNVSREWKNAIAIIGITVVIYLLVKPKKNGLGKPEKATKDEIKRKSDARTILDAYINATEAGEKPSELSKLNSIFADEYGMKVFKTKSGGFVARTLDGKDVLIAR